MAMNIFDPTGAILRILKNIMWALSAFGMVLSFGWLVMFNNYVGFARCALLSLICALVAQSLYGEE